MRKDDIVDAVEAALIDEDVPQRIREKIMDHTWDILQDELEDDDE